jgi:hypothetical protein
LLGETVHEQGNVWFYSLEDSKEEVYRRLQAVTVQHGIQYSDLIGKLYITSGLDEGKSLVIADAAGGLCEAEEVVDKLVAEMLEPRHQAAHSRSTHQGPSAGRKQERARRLPGHAMGQDREACWVRPSVTAPLPQGW